LYGFEPSDVINVASASWDWCFVSHLSSLMRGRFSGVIESEREGWESGRRLPGVVQDGLTGGAEGWTWHQVSARVTRIGVL